MITYSPRPPPDRATGGKGATKAEMDVWDARYQAIVAQEKYAGKANHNRRANADETAVVITQPTHQHVPTDAERAQAPGVFSKARITLMITAIASGRLLPAFLIVGCFGTGLDLSHTRVLRDLQAALPRPADWVLKTWTATLPIKDKKGGTYSNRTYKRPYLLNTVSDVIVTIQRKAWMDTGACHPINWCVLLS